ncbi:MAG: group II truncated hemoglobin [Opitutaceae bacterium]
MSEPASRPRPPSLYEWAGGNVALEKLTAVFYDKVFQDALLQPVFAQMGADHPKHVAAFIGEVFGGPVHYSQDHGGHAGMISKHLGKHLTQEQRKRWMDLLLASADEIGMPSDPEFRSAFVSYIEWGSRLAVINSQPGVAAAPADSPMPKWGWGEVGGPYQG